MTSLSSALEREHREIDAHIEAHIASLDPAERSSAFTALRRHIYLEEEFLFPPLRDAGLVGPIFVMLREHGELWSAMDAIERLPEPESAAACAGLLERLAAHNDKEEPIVYPEVDKISQAEAVLAMLADSTMPDGWICEQARTDRPKATPW